MATYWLPVARPDPGTNVNAIIRAFCDVFADCSLWNATPFDLMLAGTRDASGPGSVPAFAQPWRLPALRARLEEVGLELPQQIGATFLGDARLSERADREHPGAGRQPSPPPATRSPRPVVVGPGIRQRPGGHRALRQRSRPGASACRPDGVRLRAPPLARGADRGGPPVFRPPADPEPGHVGRRPAIGTDRRPPPAADRDSAAHAAALGPRHRSHDGPHRAAGRRRKRPPRSTRAG